MTDSQLREDLASPERRTVHAQTKLTPSEHADLESVRAELSRRGVDTTLSSLIRAFVLSGVRDFKGDR